MSRENYIINTIRVYRENAAALRSIKNTVKGFDGKVLNKRLETALNNTTLPDGISAHFTAGIDYDYFKISVYNYNRSFPNDPNSDGYVSTCYVDNETTNASIGKANEIFAQNSNYNYLVNADIIIEKLEEKAAYNERKAADLEKALKDRETIVKEFQDICTAFAEFNHKYDHTVLESLGILYSMRYDGSTNLKDYTIKTW